MTSRPQSQSLSQSQPQSVCSFPARALTGESTVPGDKSISHRALLLGAIAQGKTSILNASDAQDCRATLRAIESLGVRTEAGEPLVVYGNGRHGLEDPGSPVDCANSGTTMRLLCGILAAQRFDSELRGDASLSMRPMRRLVEPLGLMGAKVSVSPAGTAPIRLNGTERLTGIHYQTPVSSAQLKSCLLLAGLYADGVTTVVEPVASRDHTEKMLRDFSCEAESVGRRVQLRASQPKATTVHVPGDFSSAAFFLVAACLVKGSDLLLRDVGINPLRTGALAVLRLMGANIEVTSSRFRGSEPVADLRVRYSQLRGLTIPSELVVSSIDEFPILFIAASCAVGETQVYGVGELRHKESDRLETMARNLRVCGVEAHCVADGITIRGGGIRGGEVSAFGDHRIAMAFLVAGAASAEGVVVKDSESIGVSFPDFVSVAKSLGFHFSHASSEARC